MDKITDEIVITVKDMILAFVYFILIAIFVEALYFLSFLIW